MVFDEKAKEQMQYKIFLDKSQCENQNGKPNLRYRVNHWCATNKLGQYIATGGHSLLLLPSLFVLFFIKPNRIAYQQLSFWSMAIFFVLAFSSLIFFNTYISIVPADKKTHFIDFLGTFTRAFIWGVLPCIALDLMLSKYY